MSQAFDKNVAPTAENVEHIRSIISNNKMCMLTSVDPDTGKLHSRPMYVVFNDADFLQNRTLYFFTHKSSHKMKETGQYQSRDVNLSFSSPSDKTWLSLTGFGQISLDRSKMQQLWTSALKPWFTHGLEDPDLALIQVQVDSAEFWDSLSSMKSLMSKAKSKITGEVPRDSAMHKSVNLGAGTGVGAGLGSSGIQQQGLGSGLGTSGIQQQGFQGQHGIQGHQFGSASSQRPVDDRSTMTKLKDKVTGREHEYAPGTTGSHIGKDRHDPTLSQKPFAGGSVQGGVVEGVVQGAVPSQGLAQGAGLAQGQGPNWQGASVDRGLDWQSQQRRI